MEAEHTFQPGDPCLECQQLGLAHRLRTFYINLEEQIVKCESSSCIYPYENDLSDTEETPQYCELIGVPPTQQSNTTNFDDCDSFIENLLADHDNDVGSVISAAIDEPTAATTLAKCHVTTPDAATLNFDMTPLQLATATNDTNDAINVGTSAGSTQQKAAIEIQSVVKLEPLELMPNVLVKQELTKETVNAIKTEPATTPNARISCYFDALKMAQERVKKECTGKRKKPISPCKQSSNIANKTRKLNKLAVSAVGARSGSSRLNELKQLIQLKKNST